MYITDNVKDMKMTQSGSMLATASEDGTVRIWDVARDEVENVLKLPRGKMSTSNQNIVTFSPFVLLITFYIQKSNFE